MEMAIAWVVGLKSQVEHLAINVWRRIEKSK
jgi:hypothetical protein